MNVPRDENREFTVDNVGTTPLPATIASRPLSPMRAPTSRHQCEDRDVVTRRLNADGFRHQVRDGRPGECNRVDEDKR